MSPLPWVPVAPVPPAYSSALFYKHLRLLSAPSPCGTLCMSALESGEPANAYAARVYGVRVPVGGFRSVWRNSETGRSRSAGCGRTGVARDGRRWIGLAAICPPPPYAPPKQQQEDHRRKGYGGQMSCHAPNPQDFTIRNGDPGGQVLSSADFDARQPGQVRTGPARPVPEGREQNPPRNTPQAGDRDAGGAPPAAETGPEDRAGRKSGKRGRPRTDGAIRVTDRQDECTCLRGPCRLPGTPLR